MSANTTTTDRRCRNCGATADLIMRVPLLAARYWECAEGCATAEPVEAITIDVPALAEHAARVQAEADTVEQVPPVIATLVADGWHHDATTEVCSPDGTEYQLFRHNGPTAEVTLFETSARVELRTLTHSEALAALTAVHPAPTATAEQPAEPDLRHRLAAELHRIADDITRLSLPLGHHISLRLGVVDTRADVETWAGYLGTDLDADDNTGIPSVTARIRLSDRRHGPELVVAAQSPQEQSEVERLRARVAELEAQTAEGGAR